MRLFKPLLLALLSLAPWLHAQVPAPQINLAGNIGCQGFPCLNNGILTMTDASRAMTAQETSAVGGFKITGTWTADRTLTMPVGRFQFVSIGNGTTGGHNAIICSASGGSCLTIPNGQNATGVWFDGTNVTGTLPGGGCTSGCTFTTSTINGVNPTTGGSSSTFLNGAGSYTTPAGSGNTTSTTLGTNIVPKSSGANSIVQSSIQDDGTTVSTAEPVSTPSLITGTPSAGAKAALPSGAHGIAGDESSTAGVPAAGVDYLRWDSTSHTAKLSVNNGAESSVCTLATGCGGGGSLPTATSAGQIISSTAAGTTYAVQGQVFYNQSGDTVSSIETECASLCTYIVTVPQTITLGSNHTLNANVNVHFEAGGKWTVNGSGFTLTLPNAVSGPLSSHFAGSGSVLLKGNNLVPVEWFGAVGDGVVTGGGSGTNNTAAIQAAINSTFFGQVQFQGKAYAIGSPVTISTNGVGMSGACASTSGTDGCTLIFSTAAATDVVDLTGSSGSPISGLNITNLGLARSITATGTAAGFAMNYAHALFTNVASVSSIDDWYQLGSASGFIGTGGGFNYNGVNQFSGNLHCYNKDGSTGVQNNSDNMYTTGCVDNGGGSEVSYGVYLHGSTIGDFNSTGLQIAANVSYGFYIQCTSTTHDFCADIHLWDSILDNAQISAVFITGIPPVGTGPSLGSVDITRAEAFCSGTTPCIDIENSSGITASYLQLTVPLSPEVVELNNDTNIILSNNSFLDVPQKGINIAGGTSGSTIATNTFQCNSGVAAIFGTTQSDTNVFTGNSLTGTCSGGIYSSSSGTDVGQFFGNTGHFPLATLTTGAVGSNLYSTDSAGYQSYNLGIAPNWAQLFYFNSGWTGGGSSIYAQASTAALTCGGGTGCSNLVLDNLGAGNIELATQDILRATVSSTGINIPSGLVVGWNSDTGLSRAGTGTIDVGNGTAGDISGALKGTQLVFSTLNAQSGSFIIKDPSFSPIETFVTGGSIGHGVRNSTIGPSIASASSIAPIFQIFHVTGTSAIATITPPTPMSSTVGGCLTMIADGAWSTTTGGNILNALTASAGTMYSACYDGSSWYIK